MGFGNFAIGRVDGIGPVRARAYGGAEKAQEAVSAERTRYRSRSAEEGSLTLTTAEGDKVTISFRNQQSTKVDQAQFYGPDGSFERTRVKTDQSSQLSVSLEGQLSESELKDITALVSKLSSGITAAQGGDLEGAQQQFAPSGEVSTIADYHFAYQQTAESSFQSKTISLTA